MSSMMHVFPRCFVAGVLSVAVAGCAGPQTRGSVSLAPAEGLAWRDAVVESTRRIEPYSWTTRQADLRATLFTPRLRRAYLESRSTLHGQFAAELETELVKMGNPDEGVDAPMKAKPDSEEQVVIFVAMYVTDQKNRDIALRSSIWDTRLVRGDASVKPISIESVRSSPAVVEAFPYVGSFDDLYVVRFPLVDPQGRSFLTVGGSPLRLEVRSALADAVVEWTLHE